MKKLMTLSFSFFFAFAVWADQKIVSSKLSEVTVYPAGAMINRSAQANIPSGNTVLIFDDLTPSIDPNTIQVSGLGSFDILSVKFEIFYPYQQSKPAGIEAIEDSLKMVADQRYLLEEQDRALEEEKQMILANKKISGTQTLTVDQLNSMANFYRDRLNKISQQKLKVKNELVIVLEEQRRLNAILAGMNNYKSEQVGRILVEVESGKAMLSQFTFSYFTHQANWTPKYNIKANSKQTEIDVDYHAIVTQSTGVDWENVNVILSTSRPTANNQKPEIHPWFLDFYTNRYNQPQYDNWYAQDQLQEVVVIQSLETKSKGSRSDAYKVGSASYMGAQAVLNALNTSYKIDRKYSIMTNNTGKQVFIKSVKIPAKYSHYAVPSMENEAFLTAAIADWGSYDLVPGSATLFYENTYVGTSYIYSQTTDDTLTISLGRDRGITLTQEKVKDLCVTKKMGSSIRKNYAYEISIKNTNSKMVSILVYDRIPVSKRSEIVVTPGNLSGAKLNPETGILEWKIDIQPGERVTLPFDYEVKYPKDTTINL